MLLKLPKRTNNDKLELALGLKDLNLFLINRLKKLIQKYNKIFNRKITIYDEAIKDITGEINLDNIDTEAIMLNNFKELGKKYNHIINNKFFDRLKSRIYNWYVDNDHLLLKFMVDRGSFRNDIPGLEKCPLCKDAKNGIEHVVNSCPDLQEERISLIKKLKQLDSNTKDKTLLESIYYWYYSRDINKDKANDTAGIRAIKNFILKMYKKFGEKGKRKEENDDEDENEDED
jgi:hypothetical protein